MFTPRDNVVYSFVVQAEDGRITNLISFYNLPSQVLKSDKHTELKAAYCYYMIPSTEYGVEVLMSDALVLAKQNGFDVMNCLDIMTNPSFFETLKFGAGDGHLHYYFYNWRAVGLKPKDIGLILV